MTNFREFLKKKPQYLMITLYVLGDRKIFPDSLIFTYRVFIKYCVFFSRILESLLPLPRHHSAAIGCTKNYQPIGVTIHSHCVESFEALEGLLQRCRRGRGCSELLKNTFFPEHPVVVFLCVQRGCRNQLW